jgi:hypothetical protein
MGIGFSFMILVLALWQCVVVGRETERECMDLGVVYGEQGGGGFADFHHHEGMPVQADARRPTHYDALPGCLCDSERKGETRKGSEADCGFRNKRTVFCGMASMPLKNRLT